MAGFDPGPWGSGGYGSFHDRRYRLWHVKLTDTPYDTGRIGDNLAQFAKGGRLIDVSWGIIICDRVSPRGTAHILDHIPQLRVATY